MSLFIIMNAMMKQPQSLTKTSNPALIRRRRERSHPHAHPYHVDVDTLESSIFPPRRCNFARRAPGSSHRIRHNIQDVQQTGLPLCDVVLFQNAGIPSPLACKPASLSLSQLKAGSRAPSSHSPATPACSIRSRSARAGMKDAYEARTWRNRLRRHSRSPRTLESSPCCTSCFTKETPKWRQGPFGSHTLCNVCGLLYAKREARVRSVMVQGELDRLSHLF
ncbi:unnamed protein product [Fusarium graminearum]|uniref:Chromosome 2, complete genome n=1 Tax=Gibberella zeae (strain ATCC MYA-4620 / CBS 123657 / FGSC 9075 / NRRL 31084 / PH-1) TaxID=229533 RepID=A0A1C3YMP9_GIBZE|nr:unnamed protein product [Fusarium graminearum]